ncbi:MAG: hypothetical protein PHR96_02170 [Clostridia bacterium]|nr:hypothetical protein [Clostridia bacterium]
METYRDFLVLIRDNINSNFPYLDYCERFIVIPHGTTASIDTLEGIKSLLTNGNVIDAYVLVRKIRDNLLLNLVLLNEAYKEKPYFEDPAFDSMFDDKVPFEKRCDLIIEIINRGLLKEMECHANDKTYQCLRRWRKSKLIDSDKKKFFGYGHYYDYLSDPLSRTQEAAKLFKQSFSKLEKQLNNFVHNNGVLFGDNQLYKFSPRDFTNQTALINDCLSTIIMFFASCIFLINGALFQSSDYVDCLDIRIKPEEELKYFISPVCRNILIEIKYNIPSVYDLLVKIIYARCRLI